MLITNLIIGAAVFIFFVLIYGYLTGKGKPSNERSAIQSLGCSIMTIFNSNLKDTAHAVRSARVMKEEALQEVNRAIDNLKKSFKEGQTNMRIALKKLQDEILPTLKDQPGTLEAKARRFKKKYEESVSAGHPIEAHKQNALKSLQHKAKAMENIKRAEKNIEKLQVAIETAKADYDGNIMDLEMIKTELESMVDIPQIELNQSLNRITSLQNELSQRMNEDSIRLEVEQELSAEPSYSADMETEFNNL